MTQEERYRAPYLALLENGVVFEREEPDLFRTLRRRREEITAWFLEGPNWSVHLGRGVARLWREPPPNGPWRGLPWVRQVLDYEILAWILWYRETRDSDQFLLSDLAREIELAAGEHLGTGHLSWNQYAHRQALGRALQGLLDLGALLRLDGGSEEWAQSGSGEGLFEWTDLAPLLYAGQETAAVPTPWQRLWRALLLGPALGADDREAFALLRETAARERIGEEVYSRLGWELEAGMETALLLRPGGIPGRLARFHPGRGSLTHVVLLTAQAIGEEVRSGHLTPDDTGVLSWSLAGLSRLIPEVRRRHGEHWGSTLMRRPIDGLIRDTVDEMRHLGLLRGPDGEGRIEILPLAGRFAVEYALEEGSGEGGDEDAAE